MPTGKFEIFVDRTLWKAEKAKQAELMRKYKELTEEQAWNLVCLDATDAEIKKVVLRAKESK